MWVAKIKYQHDDCVTMPKVVKHDITVFATPGNSYTDDKYIYNTGFLMLRGSEKGKKGFIRDIKKDKKVVKVDVNKDLVIFVEKRPKERGEYSAFRSKEVMVVKPVYCNPNDGWEYWEICSWDKKHINNFLKEIRKIGRATLQSIKKMKLNDIYHFHVSPNLTSKQKEALDMAMEYGYYEIPRKVELDRLAKKMKISRQAFSEHLRKAEAKMMPVLTENMAK
jgi:predicted DNA binding protein